MTPLADRDREPRENTLRPETWEKLVDSVIAEECTPFLGAGIAVPHLPRGATLAESLAEDFDYPLDDVTNLARVTQYIANRYDDVAYAKRRVCEHIRRAQEDAAAGLRFGLPENHLVLAGLRLPLYVTTNYDDYLERAVNAARRIQPQVQICRWNDQLASFLPKYSRVKPTADSPLIFHLHGHIQEQNSILVTEDDYIDFTVSLAQRREADPVIPHFVRRALGNTNLLFIGYSLEDWNFRVLLRHIMKQQQVQAHNRYSSLSIQLSSDKMPADRRRRAEEFLEKHLKTSSAIDVYWGDASEFLQDLASRVDRGRATSRAS